ncbi:MAG: substrate-binding domain-containing protein, partial [Caldilineales bacterium]|nr:substrate-binding domain-containing protein [Caldilineales bacterium]
MKVQKLVPLIVVLVAASLIAACVAPAPAPAPAPAEQAPAEEAPTEEAPAAEGLTIAGVVFQSDTFMQTVQAGMEAAAGEAGVELILGNSENDLAKEAAMIDDYITRGGDAIVITPISADGSVAALKAAKDAGITIVCFNTCVNEEGLASAFLVTKNEDL